MRRTERQRIQFLAAAQTYKVSGANDNRPNDLKNMHRAHASFDNAPPSTVISGMSVPPRLYDFFRCAVMIVKLRAFTVIVIPPTVQ